LFIIIARICFIFIPFCWMVEWKHVLNTSAYERSARICIYCAFLYLQASVSVLDTEKQLKYSSDDNDLSICSSYAVITHHWSLVYVWNGFTLQVIFNATLHAISFLKCITAQRIKINFRVLQFQSNRLQSVSIELNLCQCFVGKNVMSVFFHSFHIGFHRISSMIAELKLCQFVIYTKNEELTLPHWESW
jgi:hypothetical protein